MELIQPTKGTDAGVPRQRSAGSSADSVPGAAFGPGAVSRPDHAAADTDALGAWAGLTAAIDAAQAATSQLWRLSDEQVVELLRTHAVDQARYDAARLALIRELHGRGWAARVGAHSTGSWLAHALRMEPRTAVADVRAALAFDPAGDVPPEPGAPVMTGAARCDDVPVLAATGRALAGGELSRAHADAVLTSVRGLPPLPDKVQREELTGKAEGALLGWCADFDPGTVRRLGKEVAHSVDPADTLAAELAAAARDELWLTPTDTGRLRLRGEVDQVTGALLVTLVEAGAAPRPSTAEGKDTRPACTRRAHAFGEVLRVAANASDKTSGGLRPHLLITMTLDSLRTDLTAAGVPLGRASGPLGDRGGPAGGGPDGGPDGPDSGDGLAAEHPALFGHPGGTDDLSGGGCAATGMTCSGTEAEGGDAEGGPSGEPSAAFAGNRAQRRFARRMAVTETGVPISAGWARLLACDATIIPIVLGANSEPLDVGRASRVVPTALRRALIARDKGCAFPGCRRPPRWCDAHHLVFWEDGGPTSLDNTVLLCDHHHHVIHDQGWTVAIIDGRPLFTPPAWLDPLRRPRAPTDTDVLLSR